MSGIHYQLPGNFIHSELIAEFCEKVMTGFDTVLTVLFINQRLSFLSISGF